ncbi:MAG: hypothetical protein NTX52_03530 [Planctomycetota bacterium]|nr:hypothetical protein [Planctomycetota bacterium]
MNIKELQFMVYMIRDADNKELIIVSLPLLPLLLGAWSVFLNSLDFLDQHDGWKLIIICILLCLYVGGLIYMKKGETKKERLKRARYHVETRLRKRGGHRASFEAIRNEVDETYSDNFLKELIDVNPEIFGTCIIKKGHKPGITLVELVEAESEDTQPVASVDQPEPAVH